MDKDEENACLPKSMNDTPPKPTSEPCDCEGYNEDGRLICTKEQGHDTEIPMPKPTTGEWTRDGTLIWCDGKIVPDIVTAHNTALAAERLRANQKEGAFMVTSDANQQLREQLAAEREKHRKEMEAVTMNTSDIETVQQLREQLADEREKMTLATQMVQIESKRANEAQQKVQTLVDALKDIRVGAPDIVKQQIKYALAKVGK